MTQPPYGYPNQPGPYGTPPPPPQRKGIGVGGGIALGCGGLLLLGAIIFVIGIFASIGDSTDPKTPRQSTPTIAAEAPAATPSKAAPPEPEPAPEQPVKIEAKKTPFTRGILAPDGPHTSVRVTITNGSNKTISVNPLYFTITATDGMKYTHELAADEQQLDAVKLAPGEKTTGVVTGKGKFTPAYVTYTDGLFGDPIRVKVS